MQETTSARIFEREAIDRLPAVLGDLFAERASLEFHTGSRGDGVDAVALVYGIPLVLHLTDSSRPGVIDAAARALRRVQPDPDRAVLVVPYMTDAGAKAARDRDLNWIDLAGNAHIFGENFYVHVEGRPDQRRSRGRPSSPFAPKSARVARLLLLDPTRWWRQAELVAETQLNNSQVSRVVRRLDEEQLIERDERQLRPRDPELLLDAWADDYRFDRHDIVAGHLSGTGVELVGTLHERLASADVPHAFTGLPAAWLLDEYARFRLCSVYVHGDPRRAADAIALRRNVRGANVQLIGPDDDGVFAGERVIGGVPCAAPVQVYLDLLGLPERADDAARELRTALWIGTE